MAIKPQYTDKDLFKHIDAEIAKKEKQILEAFAYLGEMCVNEARTQHRYTDRTGNLSSSMGYLVVNNGMIVSRGFNNKEGEAYAKREVAAFNRGIVLMVVAGMEYAGYVEAMGLDVLVSSELFAEKQIPVMMKKLGFIVR